METLTKILADGMMAPIGIVALYAILWRTPKTHRYDYYSRVVMAGASSYLLAKIIGALWQPEKMRPFEKLGIEAGASSLNNPGFPSDHALFAMFLTLAVWYVTRSAKWTGAMLMMTLLVCVGRVLAHVHTPLDVIGGIVIACFGSLWYMHDKTFFKNPLAKKANK